MERHVSFGEGMLRDAKTKPGIQACRLMSRATERTKNLHRVAIHVPKGRAALFAEALAS